jgi:hypothetical protein
MALSVIARSVATKQSQVGAVQRLLRFARNGRWVEVSFIPVRSITERSAIWSYPCVTRRFIASVRASTIHQTVPNCQRSVSKYQVGGAGALLGADTTLHEYRCHRCKVGCTKGPEMGSTFMRSFVRHRLSRRIRLALVPAIGRASATRPKAQCRARSSLQTHSARFRTWVRRSVGRA